MGGQVEMRRWWSKWDAGDAVDKSWHTILLALIADRLMHNLDPFKVYQRVAVHTDEEDEVEKFNYKDSYALSEIKSILWSSDSRREASVK